MIEDKIPNNTNLMQSNIIPFTFKNIEIRILREKEDIYFCLKDVCKILTIANHRRVLADIIDEKGVRKTYTLTAGGNQELTFINEPNLYRVIFRSNKIEAKQFQDWVFNEVLPSIRKTGGYMVSKPDDTPEEIMARALVLAQETLNRRDEEIKELKPKAEALERIAISEGSICITYAAKDLQVRPKELFDYLVQNGWIYRRRGSANWVAYQDKIQQGLLEHKVTEITRDDGSQKVIEQVKVTRKGLAKLAELLNCNEAA